jgi:hypothetical protein
VLKGYVEFVSLTGAVVTETFTCVFDEPPMGDDFFIGAG